MRSYGEVVPRCVKSNMPVGEAVSAHNIVVATTIVARSPLDTPTYTKLDGTARGGDLVAVAEKYGLPVHAIGVGEGEDDLRPFSARDFSEGLMGLSKET